MKRIQRGPVRGISLKLQEDERERRMDFVPDRSQLDVDRVDIDEDTANMLRSLDFPNIAGVQVIQNQDQGFKFAGGRSAGGRGRGRGGRGRGGPRRDGAGRGRKQRDAPAAAAAVAATTGAVETSESS